MQSEVNQIICEVMWWALVIIFGLIVLAYIAKLCGLVRYAREMAEPFQLEPFFCIRYVPFLLVMWSVLTGEANLHLIPLQAYICLGLWLFICVCAIMQSKVASSLTWGEYMKKQGQEFLEMFTWFRKVFLKIESIKDGIPTQARAAICLGIIILFAVAGSCSINNQALLTAVLGGFGFVFYICAASFSLHSCRKLLMFWLLYSAVFAGCVVLMLPRQENGLFDTIAYILFAILYTLSWSLLAGAADDEPVQMGCNIVNTMTTIALIVINVSVVWAERNLALPEPLASFWSGAQYYSTVILLPLVVAGYLAALLKSVQIYQQKKIMNIKEAGGE